jgi:hypothetical protein
MAFSREQIDVLTDTGYTMEQIHDLMRNQGQKLCCDCKHGIFQFLTSLGGQRYPSHYCELEPNDGWDNLHINYFSTATNCGKCHYEPRN